jgi:hypothetical protein
MKFYYSGMKIVCVKTDDPLGRDVVVVKGGVYTVKSVFLDEDERECVTLFEIAVPEDATGWWGGLFRPAVERKTDISALRALLVPGAKIKETA